MSFRDLLAKRRGLLLDEKGSTDVLRVGSTIGPADVVADEVDLEIPRRIFHMGGSVIAWTYLASDLPLNWLLFLLALIGGPMVVVDVLRLLIPSLGEKYWRDAGKFLRAEEQYTLTTSTYFVIACFASMALFSKTAAILAILFLSFGDPVAALVGKKFGSTKIMGKSLEGSFACFETCFLIGVFFVSPWVALWGALAAAVAELVPLPVSDNVRIPLVAGSVLTLLGV